MTRLTLDDGLAVQTVVADLLDVSEVDVAVEDAIGPFAAAATVIER